MKPFYPIQLALKSALVIIILHGQNVLSKPANSQTEAGRYNHSTSPACPDGQLYWEKTGTCFETGLQGPCGKNMTIGPSLEQSQYGRCDCQKYQTGRRGLEFDPKSNACHEYFTQGPCSSQDKWLVLKDGRPVCDKNPCLSRMHEKRDQTGSMTFERIWAVYEGQCVEVGQPTDKCNGTIVLTKEGTAVKCRQGDLPNFSSYKLSLSVSLPCPANTVKRAGQCEPISTFE